MAGCDRIFLSDIREKDTGDDVQNSVPVDPSAPGDPALSTPGTGTPSAPGDPALSTPGTGTPSVPGNPAPSTPGTGTPSPPPPPSTPAWYVSANGAEANSGTDPAKPLASVQAALSRIKTAYKGGKWPAGESAVIVVSGTITASGSFGNNMSMVDVSGAGNYPPVILKGDPVQKGVLNANRNSNNEGRVLYIGNNKVTLGENLTLTGGYTVWGGGVLVGTAGSESAGEFVMAGGEISGNTGQAGGGVMVYKGSMTMTGGIIHHNTNTDYSNTPGDGGGVYVSDYTSFTLSGGTIRENGGAKTAKGGGVCVNGEALFTMTGGEILNNSSTQEGGGVRVTGYGQFFFSGGTISGNTSAVDGAVSVSPYGGVFIQTGGTISGNTP
ncbi:MAG: hypothetical protein LBD65_03185 [Spirochaetaceae bacterium]|nr:hypothetical protein [Spirochaetaceae bacterium]